MCILCVFFKDTLIINSIYIIRTVLFTVMRKICSRKSKFYDATLFFAMPRHLPLGSPVYLTLVIFACCSLLPPPASHICIYIYCIYICCIHQRFPICIYIDPRIPLFCYLYIHCADHRYSVVFCCFL